MGNWEVPFVTRGEFLIPRTRGFAARAGISPSLQISMMGLAHFLELFSHFLTVLLIKVVRVEGKKGDTCYQIVFTNYCY